MNVAPAVVNATCTKGLPKLEPIPGTRLKRLTEDFWAYSARLRCWILIPKGFVYDEESTPWKGENPIAGLLHDYLCRYDSSPCVTKWQAGMVYLEFQKWEDNQVERKWYQKAHDFIWRGLKSGFVSLTPVPKFFHVYSVNATVGEIL